MPFSPKPPTTSWKRPCGLSREHRINLGGLALIPDRSGALSVPDFSALLVADLHLETGAALARRGLHVPPYDSRSSLTQLEAVLAIARPERLIFLGDSFHDAAGAAAMDPADRQRLAAITARHDTIWVTGNHDPHAPDDLGGRGVDALALGPVTLRHIPSPRLGDGHEIAGHLHPGATVVQRNVAVKRKCFIADARRLIMPAFGSYTGALSVSSSAFKGLFEEADARVWLTGADIHVFPRRRVA